jgi:hypothetical protein
MQQAGRDHITETMTAAEALELANATQPGKRRTLLSERQIETGEAGVSSQSHMVTLVTHDEPPPPDCPVCH